jgi:hypothetical protein
LLVRSFVHGSNIDSSFKDVKSFVFSKVDQQQQRDGTVVAESIEMKREDGVVAFVIYIYIFVHDGHWNCGLKSNSKDKNIILKELRFRPLMTALYECCRVLPIARVTARFYTVE